MAQIENFSTKLDMSFKDAEAFESSIGNLQPKVYDLENI